MIARVSLEIALRREFDYAIPDEFAGQVDVGSRVQVPFGPRKVLGVVTALAEESAHANLKSISKVIGAQTLVTPKVLRLARWIGEYYCCAPETALKSVLPEAVRKEDAAWRERLFVRVLPVSSQFPKLPKRQQEVWNLIEERREILLAELVELAQTTAATVRKLEDRGLVAVTNEISERDPYANEIILASQPIVLNPAQSVALEKIKVAMNVCSTRVPRVEVGVAPASRAPTVPAVITEATARKRNLPHFEIPGSTYHITWQTHDKLVL
jgi:primosomal protein N' (replication factor Y)